MAETSINPLLPFPCQIRRASLPPAMASAKKKRGRELQDRPPPFPRSLINSGAGAKKAGGGGRSNFKVEQMCLTFAGKVFPDLSSSLLFFVIVSWLRPLLFMESTTSVRAPAPPRAVHRDTTYKKLVSGQGRAGQSREAGGVEGGGRGGGPTQKKRDVHDRRRNSIHCRRPPPLQDHF